MKATFHKSAIALAIATVMSAPAAIAGEPNGGIPNGGNGDGLDLKANIRANVDVNLDAGLSTTEVEMKKKTSLEKDVKYDGRVRVSGHVETDSLGLAVINSRQFMDNNEVYNLGTYNDASIEGQVMQNAGGNLGVNVAAGDNNAQSNSAALAASDAYEVFDHGDSEIFGRQDAEFNYTGNYGTENSAWLGDRTFQNASGNIGINITAGANNAQQNNLAMTAGAENMAEAGVNTKQVADHNSTENTHFFKEVFNDDLQTASVGSNGFGGLTTTNFATIEGDALQNVRGNIGVNISSGSNNLQSNNLSLVSAARHGHPTK